MNTTQPIEPAGRLRQGGVLLLIFSSLIVSGCGRFMPIGEVGPEENWPEVFDFELKPGDRVGDDLDAAVMSMMDGDLVPGSARHLATVDTPGGRTDFYSVQIVNSPDMPGRMFCTITDTGSGGSAGCGDEPDLHPPPGLQESGLGASQTWQGAEFTVSEDTVRVVGITDDGTEYSIVPLNRFGYVQWRADRGLMELTALDVDGDELQSITVGMSDCEIMGRC